MGNEGYREYCGDIKEFAIRITTPQIQENGILAPMLHGGRFGCGGWFWVGAMANAADFGGQIQSTLGPSGPLG